MRKTLLLTLALLLSSFALQAQITATIGGIKYALLNGKATVLEQGDALTDDIVIPAQVSHGGVSYRVAKLAEYAFKDTKITSISLPEGIDTLSTYCFRNCRLLASVKLPESLRHLGSSCFEGCESLATLTLPQGLASLAHYCFYNCTNLISISLPESVTKLGGSNFNGCTNLQSVTLPATATEMRGEYFRNCSNLISVRVPEGVKELGPCFSGCYNLTFVYLPQSIIKLGEGCFSGCRNLVSIDLPKGITELPRACFNGCSNLTSIVLPEGITELDEWCFSHCTNLSAINLPQGVTYLGRECFKMCTSFSAIRLPKKLKDVGNYCFSGCENLTKVFCEWEQELMYVSIGSGAFDYGSNCKLYVPQGCMALYKDTKAWPNKFAEIIEYNKDEEEQPLPQCATPTITFTKGELNFNCTTEGAEFRYSLSTPDAKPFINVRDGKVTLDCQYHIEAYATAKGHLASEVITATLYFLSPDENDETALPTPTQRGVVVTITDGTIRINGLAQGESVSLYTTGGTLVSTTSATAGIAVLQASSTLGSIAIVKIGGQALKVTL